MKNFILCALTVLTLLLAACSKEDLKINLNGSWGGWGGSGFNFTITGNNFDSTALGYIVLPWNRNFIYKDSASGAIDSVAVTISYNSFVYHDSVPGNPPVPHFWHETYKLTLSKLSGSSNLIWFDGFASCDSQYRNSSNFIDSNFIFSNQQNNLPALWYPFTSSGFYQYSYIPTLTIEGTVYTQVHKFFATNGSLPNQANYQGSIFYWVKGIGIIKKQIITYNSVRTSLLVRYW